MTDKHTNGLTPYYEDIFKDYKNKPCKILEVGTYKNGFLEWLHEYLPQAELFGMDINPIPTNIATVVDISQRDTRGLIDFGALHGPFDVIIDDGAHAVVETTNTFKSLWPRLKSNGTYIVEDWIIGYWARQNPERYGHGAMMDALVVDFIINKESYGIQDIKIILEAPKCSLAILKKL